MTDSKALRLMKAMAPLLRVVRTDVTAVKKLNGESAWTRDPLTKALVARHLGNGPPRGVCPIKEGSSETFVGLLDLDSHKGEVPWARMAEVAREIAGTADLLYGIKLIAFRSSGGSGMHLYALWPTAQDARSVRAALADVLAQCGYDNGTKGVAHKQIEVFPKQDEVSAGGFGNQFILPLANKSVPLNAAFEPMPREWLTAAMWEYSTPVPVVERERPQRVEATAEATHPISVVRAALFSIPNDGDAAPDYDMWRDLVFAVHDATGGSDEGLELVLEWSEQNPVHNEAFVRQRVWPYVKTRGDGKGKTFKTLAMHARKHGFNEDAHAADYFENLDETEPLTVPQVDVFAPESVSTAMVVSSSAAQVPAALPSYQVNARTGAVRATVDNLVMAIERPDISGRHIAYDAFRDELMWAPAYTEQWQSFADSDYVWLRQRLEREERFEPISRELMRDVVGAVATRNQFDSAQLWLRRLKWDGVPRVERFLIDYWGAKDTPYARAVAYYMWTAMAGRVMSPGCKADMVPIAIGVNQGEGKSSGVAAMVPGPEFTANLSFTERDADMARKMRGKLIAEFGELRGLHTRELEAIKDFVTWTHEEWVPKFREFATKFPRRLLFFGTTNHPQFLSDDTGNRRWLPFYVGRVDVSRIAQDHEQLWAEARVLHAAEGVMWQAAEELGRAQHTQHVMGDVWDQRVSEWLEQPGHDGAPPPMSRPYLRTFEVLTEGLGFEAKHVKRAEEMRVGSCLARLGYQRKQVRLGGHPTWCYVPVPTVATSDGR